MKLKKISSVCVFSMFLLFLSSVALAQRDVGTFLGTVFDSERQPLPGVTITAKNVQTGLVQESITNLRGGYRIERLPRGIYTVTASVQGFKTLSKEGYELFAGAEFKVNFTLELGGINEEVTVIGEAPMIETTRAQVSTVITEKELLSYPQENRNYLYLMQYAPGTQPGASTTQGPGYAVNGMRGESNNYMIDGLDNNELTDHSFNISVLPVEAMQEFRLITNNFSAEYGRNIGGVLNVLMKSGTNELHGSGWIFHRGDSALFKSADWLTHTRPPYKRYQYGATLGGPIIKDKTFFFANFEGISQDEDYISPRLVFTPEAIAKAQGAAKEIFDIYPGYPVPTYDFRDVDNDGVPDYGRVANQTSDKYKSFTFALKIDHIFSSKDRIALRWVHNNQENEYDMYSPLAWTNNPGETGKEPRRYHTGGLTWLHLFSPNAYNELRIGIHKSFYEKPSVNLDIPIFSFSDGVDAVGGGGGGTNSDDITYQLADVLSFQKGNHSIKVGGEARIWEVDALMDWGAAGNYSYLTGMEFINNEDAEFVWFGANPPDPDPNNPYVPGDASGEWAVGAGGTHRIFRGKEIGLFIQDDWRVSERFTLSAGLRWEYYSVPKEVSGKGINQPAFGTQAGYESTIAGNLDITEGEYGVEGIRYLIFDGRELNGKGLWEPFYKGFSPKVSFAYDLTGDGKTSLRAGVGLSYERQMARQYANDRLNYPDFTYPTFYGEPYGFPPIYATIPGEIPTTGVTSYQVSLRWMDPNLRPQKAFNWLIGIQRELAPNLSVEIDYTGSAGRDIGAIFRPNRFTGDGLDGTFDGINPYVTITDCNTRENKTTSNYHGLQIILNKRFSNGWSWYTAYTYSVAKDTASSYQSGAGVSQERWEMEYAYANYDHRHRLVGGFVYDVPFFKKSNSWFIKNFVAGWQIASSFHYTSGGRFTVRAASRTTDWNLDGNRSDRPLWLGDDFSDIIGWSGGWPQLDKSLLGEPNPPEYEGDLSYYDQSLLGRNTFTWFPTYNINISIQKYFTVPVGGRDVTFQLIGEIFNLLNNTFWNLPQTRFERSTFGEVTRKSGNRIAQLSMRVMF